MSRAQVATRYIAQYHWGRTPAVVLPEDQPIQFDEWRPGELRLTFEVLAAMLRGELIPSPALAIAKRVAHNSGDWQAPGFGYGD